MEKIQPGKYVEMIYDLYVTDENGDKLVHQVDPEHPEKIVFGVTRGVIAPLEKALEGLQSGDAFDVKVSAEEGFGKYDPDQVVHLEKDIFEIDGKFDSDRIKVGEVVPMMTADGYRIDGKVVSIDDKEVVMDFNHPLADKPIHFVGKVLTVREATPEELQPAHGCGCGCGHDHCGDGCGDGCGDNCGCDSDKNGCGCH